jgi:hypothetical protein
MITMGHQKPFGNLIFLMAVSVEWCCFFNIKGIAIIGYAVCQTADALWLALSFL